MALTPHPFLPGAELDPGAPMPEEMMIDLSEPAMSGMHGDVAITEGPEGVTVDFEPGVDTPVPMAAQEHDANLAEHLTESELAVIAAQIEEWVEADIASRSQWFERLAEGLELLGVVPPKDNMSNVMKLTEKVNHPLIAEACVQFRARAMAELVPPGGPAKGQVLGEATKELEDQADRVAGYLNYQLMTVDRVYRPETDRMLFVLSKDGSQFKKVYRDDLTGRKVSRWVRGEDFIVPYGATSLESAPRFTHQIVTERNDMKKLQRSGFYRNVSLTTPTEGPTRNDQIQNARDEAEGVQPAPNILDDMAHTVWECACDWDLKGFEDVDERGEPTGIALPYLITIDKESRKVLAIRRNWKENDPKRVKRIAFVHYPYLPGDGFYSYGLIHLIGGLGHAATGLLKTIMIGAAFASMQGGFKSKDARLPSGVELEWGKWQDTDMTADELAKAFYTPAFKEPSEALFKVLGLLVEAAQRFSSTTESMVGDASNTGPVGTTVALIEQGSKVYSDIHARLHFAQGEELRLLAELEGEDIPEEGYPYNIKGASRQVFRQDFDDRVDVVPVSNPNIFSSTQRIAISQTLVQRATEAPDLYDRRKVEERFLEALKVADPDDVLVNRENIQRCDPVTENALLLVGKPAKAYEDQDHQAHITVHMDLLHKMEAEKNPALQRLAPIMLAHVAEHEAYAIRLQMMQAMGMPLPAVNFDAKDDEPVAEQLPPQIENQLAQRAAMVIQQMRQQMAAQQQAAMQQQAMMAEQEQMQAQQQSEAPKLEQMAKERDKAVAELDQHKRDAKTKAIVDEGVRRVEKALGQSEETKQQ